jgi:pantetheine-phosphate adenylyltransferase
VKVAVYPGSFDPVTRGHIDILERSSKLFDRIIVAVVHNVNKKGLFTLDERVEMIREATRHVLNVEVDCFSGLLVDYIAEKGACGIVRGLRTVSDFEYEMHMAMMNHQLLPEVETLFIMSSSQYMFISSSIVKEAALLGGSVGDLVPPNVEARLQEKWKERQKEKGLLD